jgi:hypothetical protein
MQIAIAYTSRGNDLNFAVPSYILKISREFPDLDCVAALSLWGPATERLFHALAHHPADAFHMIDTDVIPPDDALVKMLKREVDICAAPIFMYDASTNDIHLNICRTPERKREHQPGTGLEECFGASFACCLIRKRVLQKFVMASEKFTEPSDLTADLPDPTPPPDAIFYHKAQKMGFPTYMDWDIPIGTHHKMARINVPMVVNTLRNYGSPRNDSGN